MSPSNDQRTDWPEHDRRKHTHTMISHLHVQPARDVWSPLPRKTNTLHGSKERRNQSKGVDHFSIQHKKNSVWCSEKNEVNDRRAVFLQHARTYKANHVKYKTLMQGSCVYTNAFNIGRNQRSGGIRLRGESLYQKWKCSSFGASYQPPCTHRMRWNSSRPCQIVRESMQ